MRTITITEALNELKLYDSKIYKAIQNCTLVGSKKKSADMCNHVKTETFEKKAKADYQSINDLIRNRNVLKSKIVQSNAVTTVKVNEIEMTVAECIERKNSIDYELSLLSTLKNQYTKETTNVTKNNTKVDAKIDELLSTLIGKDSEKKLTKEDTEAIENPYREKNEFELVDPINIVNEIEKLESEIDGFISNCDTALVLSNATTFIEIDF